MAALLVVSMAAADVHADPTSNPQVGASSEATKDLSGTLEESGHFKTLVKAIEAAGCIMSPVRKELLAQGTRMRARS